MKQIKVTENTKQALDRLKNEKETYNIVIQRLIRQNECLKQEYKRIYQIALNLSKKD